MASRSHISPETRRQREDNRRSATLEGSLIQRNSVESPSRQLLVEFSRLLIDQDQHLQDELDKQIEKQAILHREALAQAAKEHERIRRNAEVARERVELELERERKRLEMEERQRLEKERQAKVEREAEQRKWEREKLEREQREHTAGLEEERKIQQERSQFEANKRLAEEKLAQTKKASEEQAKARAREAAANATRARAEAEKSAQPPSQPPTVAAQPSAPAAAQTAQAAQSTTSQPAAAGTLQAEFEDIHKRYLEAHKQLKQMREHVISESKKSTVLKTKLGDWRRDIVKCMGQLTADKLKNRGPLQQIISVLQGSLAHTQPSIDVSPYLISVPHPSPGQPIPLSGVFFYLLNIFSKSVTRQFVSESSGGAKAADPVGVVAVTVFATPAFKLHQSVPLIDVLLAKFHLTCPPLFSISGSTKTAAGRIRLGWQRDGASFIPEQRHLERMAGLSTGWAALTLRDFSKSRNDNPLPNWHYWRAIAALANTPTGDFGPTTATLIKGLVEGFVQRFLGFYGAQAKAALRVALVDLPARVARDRKGDAEAERAVKALEVLREVLGRDLRISF